jgi:membrane protein DedA with SNARE-associated domain
LEASRIETILFHWITHYGYLGLFGSLVLGIVGLPVPDELLMTFTGYMVYMGKLHYGTSLAVGVAGSLAGMSVSYFIGSRFGYPLLEKFGPKIHFTREKWLKTHAWFERFGKFAVTVGYFIPGLRHLSSYFAGIGKWPYRTFIAFAFPGGLLWCFVFITLGRVLGKHWKSYTQLLHKYMLEGFMLLLLLVLCWWLVRTVAGRSDAEGK